MKKIILIISGFLLTIGSVSSFAQTSEQDQVKQVLIAMWDAIEKGDIDEYSKYIHPDFSSFGEYDTYLSEGKRLEIQGVSSWISRADNIHTEMHQPKITIRDNTAWITYYWTDSSVSGGKRSTSRGKSTRIFVKESGKWLCIHGHYTAVP